MSILLVAAAMVVLLIAPGFLILRLAKLGGSWEPPEQVAIAFALGLALFSLLAWLLYPIGRAGLNVLTFGLAGLGVLVLLLGVGRLAARGPARLKADALDLVRSPPVIVITGMATGGAILGAWAGPWLCCTADSFWHLAAMQSLGRTGRTLVDHAMYLDGHSGIDPLGTTWHTALASAARLTGADAVAVWSGAVPVSAAILIVSFYVFAIAILRNRYLALAATVVHFVLFQALDFRYSGQPNQLALAPLWIALALWLNDREQPRVVVAIVVAVLAGLLAALHFFIFEVFVLQAGGYIAAAWLISAWRHRHEDHRTGALSIGVAATIGAVIFFARSLGTDLLSFGWQGGGTWQPEVWPTLGKVGSDLFSALAISTGSLGEQAPFAWMADWRVLDPPLVFASAAHVVGFALALVLAPRALRGEKPAVFLVVTTAMVPLLTFNPLVISILFERITDIPLARLARTAPLALVLVSSGQWAWTSLSRSWRRLAGRGRPKLMAAGALAALVGLSMAITVPIRAVDAINGMYFDSENGQSVLFSRRNRLQRYDELFAYLRDETESDSVILADQAMSYYVAGLTGRPAVYVQKLHWPGNVPTENNWIRAQAVFSLFPTPSDSAADLERTLTTWQVDYLLVDRRDWTEWDLPDGAYDFLSTAFERDGVFLYRVNPPAGGG